MVFSKDLVDLKLPSPITGIIKLRVYARLCFPVACIIS